MSSSCWEKVPLFKDLPQKYLNDLTSISRKIFFEKDQVVFTQGEQANGFYVVISGRVKVYKLSLEGKEQILHVFGPGEPIGEVPVFAGETFPANAQALDNSELVFCPRRELRELFTKDPSLAMNMLAVLAKRLREFTVLIEDLSLRELSNRLATYIIHLQDIQHRSEEVVLDISKGNLANILGTSQESLSRMFKKMNDLGIIKVDKRNIQILDQARLEDISEGFENL